MSSLTYRIAEVALRVTDLDQAVAFYRNVLGFTFHKSEPGVVFLEIGELDSPLGGVGHPQLLALFSRGDEVNVGTSSFDHIAFEIPATAYDTELARYEEEGMVIREREWPESLPWKGRAFFFRDPEGNVIEIIAANRD